MRNPSLTEADSLPLSDAPGHWRRWLGLGVSLVMVACLAWQLAKIGWAPLVAALPTNPLYYLLMAAMYLALPLSETWIYHRLWALPLSSVRLFLRKRVLNEAVIGYSGEAYIYLWARRQTGLANAMGTVKDVSITSALAGNGMTVVLVVLMLGFSDRLVAGGLFSTAQLQAISWGALLLTVPGFVILIFSKRIMSLPRADNARNFGIHLVRLLLSTGLLLLAWHVAMPAVTWKIWAVLAALRLVVSRVPFAPNTDLLFATVGMGLTAGANSQIAALLAVSAAMPLIGHALVLASDATMRLWTARGVMA